MNWKPAIGLEVHVQLKTRSKLFCGCSTAYGSEPNTQVCPVCLGYPGAMPVLNREAVRLTVRTGLMIGSEIPGFSKFDRKSYFYPDMPKNYQVSQYDQPFCVGGGVDIQVEGRTRRIRIVRIHLEEDVAKNMHFRTVSGIDFNRGGVPLMEIVSYPDLESPEEAQAFLLALKQILQYIDVSDCNLEAGNIRCDVNCSVRPADQAALGTKTEIKNMNTFKGVFHALEHEIQRQVSVLEGGGRVYQETLRWDPDAGATHAMRSKEDAHDYRYFPEPDLPPVRLDPAVVDGWRASLPEAPRVRRERLVREYGIPDYDAGVLTADQAVADYFEAAVRHASNAKAVSNWIMTEMLRRLSERAMDIRSVRISPESLGNLVQLTERRTLNSNTAKDVFAELFEQGGDPRSIVERRGLARISDPAALESLVDRVLTEQARSAADYRAGKAAALQFLVGQVMRLSKGQADPHQTADLLKSRLKT
ncbi:MAG: glutaminyl-tRNA synthase (glutamine-hydrolyzing) subunit B [Lentisphaerae bacterium RIFOXYC12_FULL_60_16]|nr:MAG: glutaminyl-tRNA synthase (glutamine-hydrolyzing) subunit B [Lentisphaerae bacterium RIFOXYC12_FULL_60_16]OGV75224.1 MAG: glutaminyl-tRNA synthase (glutamine-hydrolyzing) subunit B [Lentisphaerae bacterium RIFOXYB12_FULL_60_10]